MKSSLGYFSTYNSLSFFNETIVSLDNLHFFCVVTEVYSNYAEVRSVCPVNNNIYKWLFVRKNLYTEEGVFAGVLASFHGNSSFIVFFVNFELNFKHSLRLFIHDCSYSKVVDENGEIAPYDYDIGVGLSIFEKDEKYLSIYGL